MNSLQVAVLALAVETPFYSAEERIVWVRVKDAEQATGVCT